jgi:tRNA/rRNA methyltransferase
VSETVEGSDQPVTSPVQEDAAAGVPTVAGRSLARWVHAAHEDGIEDLKAGAIEAGLSGTEVESLLDYCAKRRCEAAGLTCPGCVRRTEAEGFTTIDAFIGAHAEITFRTTATRLEGPGERRAVFDDLDHMQRTWAGEPYWFWSRRVLRKWRYGIRKAAALQPRAEVTREGPLDLAAPAILLMAPQIAENIGMVARAMGNFGLDDLRVIDPRDGWPSEKARAVASGASALIDEAILAPTLGDSMADLNWVCATTARQRDMRKPVLTPEQAVAEIRRRTAGGERCGILFGRERNGLTSEEVADCDAIVMIPVRSEFASLNLAQAVLLVGYEWLKAGDDASLGRVTTYESPISTGVYLGRDIPATKAELLGFFEHLEGELDRLGFFFPSERRHVVVRNLRNMFARMDATSQEVRTLRGIVANLAEGRGRGRKVSGRTP